MTHSLTEAEISARLRQAYKPGTIGGSDGEVEWLEDAEFHCAAVLIPLAWYQDEWQVVLTRRTDTVETHKGQVSFPGGGCNADEASPEATALREAEEEIGLQPEHVRILGKMNDQVTITGFRVTPVVGVIPWPYPLRPEPNEVARIFSIPLAWLASKHHWEETPFTPEGARRPFQVVTYEVYDGEILWGASGRIMLDLVRVLGI